MVTLWRQVPRRRRFAGGLLAVSWWWAVGGDWWCDLLGPMWWPGWAGIVSGGMALAVVQARRVSAWWRRQNDLAARADALTATLPARNPGPARGRVYVSGRRDWAP